MTDGTQEIDAIGGPKLYQELVPALALGVEAVSKRLAERDPHDMRFSFGGITDLHKEAFQGIVAWAGRIRTKDVVVSYLFPPPFYQCNNLLNDFAGTLEYRVSALDQDNLDPDVLAELFAFCEGRFTYIHPFRDFNGRVSRFLTWWLVLRLRLPDNMEIISPIGDLSARQEVIDALGEYDRGNHAPLIGNWRRRLDTAFLEVAQDLRETGDQPTS